MRVVKLYAKLCDDSCGGCRQVAELFLGLTLDHQRIEEDVCPKDSQCFKILTKTASCLKHGIRRLFQMYPSIGTMFSCQYHM